MGPLPVRALRLAGDTVTLLKRLGLQTVGDLAMVPRISLARRFSRAALVENPLLRLDQMMGRLAEPVNAPDDPPRFAVQARLAEPVQDPSDWVPGLCDELCGGLGAAGFGARRLVLTVYRTDGEVASVEVATSQPSRDAAHLARLFDGKLDRIDPGFGFDLITLGASVAETMTVVQTRLDGGADDGTELARLIDRLTARLGAGAIRAPIPRDSHIPERAEDWTPALHQQNQKRYRRDTDAIPTRYSPRPLRLFDHPEEIRVVYAVPEGPPAQFVWRRITHKVTRFEGPERIAPEWWQDLPGTRLRDYYRVEDHTGKRIWIYRDGVLGDGRGATPRWFVHGVFA
jgi:protein ImuB